MFTTESESYVNSWYNNLPEDLYKHATQILYNFKVFISCLTPKATCKAGKEDIYKNFLVEEALSQLKLNVYLCLQEHNFKSTEKKISIPTLFKRALHSNQMLSYFRSIYKTEYIAENILCILAICPEEREKYSKEYLDNVYMHSPYTIPNIIQYDTWPKDFQAIVRKMPLTNLNRQLAYIDYKAADEYNNALFAIIQGRVITNEDLFTKYWRINSYCSRISMSSQEYEETVLKKEIIFIKNLQKTIKNKSRAEYIEIISMYVMRICIRHSYTSTDRINYFKKFIDIDGLKEFHVRMLIENQPMNFYLNLFAKKYAEKPIKCNNNVIKFTL